eukprot:scaffold1330_cov240-Pinguiococcus_pyrenoidosus.AAC.36
MGQCADRNRFPLRIFVSAPLSVTSGPSSERRFARASSRTIRRPRVKRGPQHVARARGQCGASGGAGRGRGSSADRNQRGSLNASRSPRRSHRSVALRVAPAWPRLLSALQY